MGGARWRHRFAGAGSTFLQHLPGPRHKGVEGGPAKHGQECRHQGQTGNAHHKNGQAEGHGKAVICPIFSQKQRQERKHHGKPAHGNGSGRAADRAEQRFGLVLLLLQRLPEAGDQEQAIIRPGAEQENGHNGQGLGIHLNPAHGGNPADNGVHHRIGKAHSHNGNQRQNRRAVDQKQNDQNQKHRADQQGNIRAFEQSHRIHLDAHRTGHPGAELRAIRFGGKRI
ncbi:hypothetical protein D3C75_877680 [compost metagenome]